MNTLKINTLNGHTDFSPGEKVELTIEWMFDDRPNQIEVRLVWYTKGKGDTDIEIVDSIRFEQPRISESERCTFQLPEQPYSFSGKLISLIWAVEVIAEPSGDSQRLDIVVAPDGQEVVLHNKNFE